MKCKRLMKRVGALAMVICLGLPFCCYASESETAVSAESAEAGASGESASEADGVDASGESASEADGAGASDVPSLEDAKEKRTELEGDLAEARRAVRELSESKKSAAEKVDELQTRLDTLSGEEDRVSQNLEDLSNRISDSKTGLLEARKAADEQYEQMKARIRYMYENGGYRMLDLIFSSGSIGELLKSVEYITAVYTYDREMLDAYRGYLDAIAQRTAELEGEYLEAEEMKDLIADRHAAISVLLEAKNEEVERIDGDLSEAEKVKQEYEQEVAAQNEVLLAIQAEIARQAAEEEARRAEEEAKRRAEEEARKKAEEEAKRKAEEEAKKKAEEAATAATDEEEDEESEEGEDVIDEDETEDEEYYDGNAEEESESSAASTSASGFIWPCPASHTITSEYGTREAPLAGASTEHRGIDIGAPQGSAIVAAQSGTVITATYSESGGNMIVISHGKNSDGQLVCTAYMHASELYVSVGDQVSQGETIAAVGSTGYSTGPHLHFGVTVGGSYVNPHGYV